MDVAEFFKRSAESLLCDGYSLVIRYFAVKTGSHSSIIDASLGFGPRPASKSNDFTIQTSTLVAGMKSINSLKKSDAMHRIGEAISGALHERPALALAGERPSFYSETLNRDLWFRDLHLQITGSALGFPQPWESSKEDSELRALSLPFDGVSDLMGFLGLVDRRSSSQGAAITIRVGPPADIDLGKTKLENNQLTLSVNAHARLDTSKVRLGMRVFPATAIKRMRSQISGELVWRRPKDGIRVGEALLQLHDVDSSLLLLGIEDHTVRRHWFVDPVKAANTRLVATQLFDRDLKQLRKALLENEDSQKFELAIGSLLFLFGFAAAVQVETQAPDLVVSTPAGSLLLVECTTRVADFSMKVGKLVDRKHALRSALQQAGQPPEIEAILVSSQPRSQVAADERALAKHGITLLCREQIAEGLNRLRFPQDPEQFLVEIRRARAALDSPIG